MEKRTSPTDLMVWDPDLCGCKQEKYISKIHIHPKHHMDLMMYHMALKPELHGHHQWPLPFSLPALSPSPLSCSAESYLSFPTPAEPAIFFPFKIFFLGSCFIHFLLSLFSIITFNTAYAPVRTVLPLTLVMAFGALAHLLLSSPLCFTASILGFYLRTIQHPK